MDMILFSKKTSRKPLTTTQVYHGMQLISTVLKYGHISDWDTSLVVDMSSLFDSKTIFNGNISDWNVSNVKNMESMFFGDYCL